MKYPEFQQIIETMKLAGYDYKSGHQWLLKNLERRKSGEEFLLQEHIRALIFAQLSNQRPWKPIQDNTEKINQIFHNYDDEYLKNTDPEIFVNALLDIKCGNRQIKKQMAGLRNNIEMLEKIASENASIDNYYNTTHRNDIIKQLSSGEYKLKQMGVALVSEYLKSVGVDIIKPDVHICRLLGRLGYTSHSPAKENEAFVACHEIAEEYGLFEVEVDSILWQFCADGYFQCCCDNPHCSKCCVKICKYRDGNE